MVSTTSLPHSLKLSIFSVSSILTVILALSIAPALRAQAVDPVASSMRPFSKLGVGVNVGTLGIGVEAATPLANRFNLRGGGNFFSYSRNIDRSGLTYVANLDLRSVQASLDWFPFGGSFHLSPGAMVYNGTKVAANVQVPTNTAFTLNGVDYYSDPSDPLSGSAKVTFPVAGPQFTAGFGNMVPRKDSKHFSVPFEFGFVYFGTGTTLLNFNGSACTSPGGVNCQKASSYPGFQTNVTAEEAKIEKYVKYARFYPILRIGVSYKF